MRFCFIFITLLILASCADLDKTNQQQKISDIQKTTDSLLLVLNEANINDLNPEFNKGEELLNNMAQLLQDDTIQETEAKKIATLSQLIDDFSDLELSFQDLKDELVIQQKTLKNLKQDISEGNGKRHKYNSYIKFEKEKVQKLDGLISDYKELKTETTNKLALQIEIVNDFYLSKKEEQQ